MRFFYESVYIYIYIYIYIYMRFFYESVYIYINIADSLASWVVFANSTRDLISIPDHIIPQTLKMVLVTSSLNTQQYKVHIKGKLEQSSERSSILPYTSV